MATAARACELGSLLSLVFLCSCATQKVVVPQPIEPQLPPEVNLNEDAGRGGWVIVTVRLESGKELPFIVDTGSSGTLFDKSLEPLLSKGSDTVSLQMWGAREQAELYAAPALYLGRVPLMTGRMVATHDFNQISSMTGRPILGCLGMDCLRHYCIQLDLAAGKMRFLDDTQENRETWGKAFPITDLGRRDPRPCVSGNLLGARMGRSQIDTGDHTDGWLRPEFYRQWTNQAKLPAAGQTRSPQGAFGGETYPEISLRNADVVCDGIGLHFLSRHLVTLDFPNQTMYLKCTSVGPLPNKGFAAVMDFLKGLKDNGQLPGWSELEHGDLKAAAMDPDFTRGTVTLGKKNDSFGYHYTVSRASKDSPWKLQKAWRTDQNARTIQEYSLP